jgi:hypothetical protein
MEFYGISGRANDLIKSYVQDRFQRMLIDHDSRKYTSEWKAVKHEVPQGSILGPLFFLLYVNNLPKIISNISNPFLFADDTSMIITNSDLQELKKYTQYYHTIKYKIC